MSHSATTQPIIVDGSPTDETNMESSPTLQRRENAPKSNVSSPAPPIGLVDVDTVCDGSETADATKSVIDEAAVTEDENVTPTVTPTQTAVAAKENDVTTATEILTEVIADGKSTMVTQSIEVSVIIYCTYLKEMRIFFNFCNYLHKIINYRLIFL